MKTQGDGLFFTPRVALPFGDTGSDEVNYSGALFFFTAV